MTQQKISEIIKGNKLIARFMGLKIKNNFIVGERLKTIHALKYDSSWDALMPVVEKIQLIGHDFYINGYREGSVTSNDANIMTKEDFDKGLILQESASKIECTWKACVEFIKWNNKQKKEK